MIKVISGAQSLVHTSLDSPLKSLLLGCHHPKHGYSQDIGAPKALPIFLSTANATAMNRLLYHSTFNPADL